MSDDFYNNPDLPEDYSEQVEFFGDSTFLYSGTREADNTELKNMIFEERLPELEDPTRIVVKKLIQLKDILFHSRANLGLVEMNFTLKTAQLLALNSYIEAKSSYEQYKRGIVRRNNPDFKDKFNDERPFSRFIKGVHSEQHLENSKRSASQALTMVEDVISITLSTIRGELVVLPEPKLLGFLNFISSTRKYEPLMLLEDLVSRYFIGQQNADLDQLAYLQAKSKDTQWMAFVYKLQDLYSSDVLEGLIKGLQEVKDRNEENIRDILTIDGVLWYLDKLPLDSIDLIYVDPTNYDDYLSLRFKNFDFNTAISKLYVFAMWLYPDHFTAKDMPTLMPNPNGDDGNSNGNNEGYFGIPVEQ